LLLGPASRQPPDRAAQAPFDPAGPPAQAIGLALLVCLVCGGCGSWSWGRRSAGPAGIGLGPSNRQDPALSGDGKVLASVVLRGGRDSLLLQEQPSGRELPLRQLRRFQPHRSPSLSWNGRYVAVLGQQGNRPMALIEDRASGKLQRLPLPGDQQVERLSLAPDGRRLALEVVRQGQSRLELLDLSPLLEPDLPPGLLRSGGGPNPADRR
jgi:hypothetical protein